jgi:hypothetical protein
LRVRLQSQKDNRGAAALILHFFLGYLSTEVMAAASFPAISEH